MFVTYNYSTGRLKVFRDSKNLLLSKKVKEENLGKEDPNIRAGVICQGIRKGHSVDDLATGKGWRPSQDEFLVWVEENDEIKDMFHASKRARYNFIRERYVSLSKKRYKSSAKEAKRVSRLEQLEKTLKLLESDKKWKDDRTIIQHTSWE